MPEGVWDYFCLDNVLYHGRILTILYDKTGERYGRGKGLHVFVDGEPIAGSPSLRRITGTLAPAGQTPAPLKHAQDHVNWIFWTQYCLIAESARGRSARIAEFTLGKRPDGPFA